MKNGKVMFFVLLVMLGSVFSACGSNQGVNAHSDKTEPKLTEIRLVVGDVCINKEEMLGVGPCSGIEWEMIPVDSKGPNELFLIKGPQGKCLASGGARDEFASKVLRTEFNMCDSEDDRQQWAFMEPESYQDVGKMALKSGYARVQFANPKSVSPDNSYMCLSFVSPFLGQDEGLSLVSCMHNGYDPVVWIVKK